MKPPQLQRVAEIDRQLVEIEIDGWQLSAMVGDTILVAMLTQRGLLRQKQEGEAAGAGFCLMGACQDCWVWLEDGRRVRACTTYVEPGLRIRTTWPDQIFAS
ncbi:MAG TPA: (2Fe-2S)-binding protein [Dongiaceae bacterium]|nr:(2Fe-2S)-binding protein [Dongiaceae bacterium]